MFVCGGMEYQVWLCALEDLPHTVEVAYVGNYGFDFGAGFHCGELKPEVVERGLGLVYEYNFFASELNHLAGNLGAYRSGGSGYEYHLVGELAFDCGFVHLYGVAAKEVFYFDFVDLRRALHVFEVAYRVYQEKVETLYNAFVVELFWYAFELRLCE